MKKLFVIIVLCLLLVSPVNVFAAAGTVIQGSVVDVGEDRLNSNPIRTITFLCTHGEANAAGDIPNTVLSARNFEKVQGWCFRGVEAYPTSGGTAPDAASVLVYDAQGMDLLGSEDGATAYAGLNLVHATLKKRCFPDVHLTRAGLHVNYFPVVTSTLTLDVTDQISAGADYTIVFIFSR
jgi:hypothetical protein